MGVRFALQKKRGIARAQRDVKQALLQSLKTLGRPVARPPSQRKQLKCSQTMSPGRKVKITQ